MKRIYYFPALLIFSLFILTACGPSLPGLNGGDIGSSRGTGQPAKVGDKCASSADCGIGACSEMRDQSIQAQCIDGKCAKAEPLNCGEDKVCMVDSRGADCYDKAIFTMPRPTLGCTANTGAALAGFNPFSVFNARCQDDCAPPKICDGASCTCEDPPGNPPAPCENPSFYSNYELADMGISGPDFSFIELSDIYLSGLMAKPEPNQMLLVPAFKPNNQDRIYPFPDQQFAVIPPPPTDQIHGTYCANDHYDARDALTSKLEWVERPDDPNKPCIFGNADTFDGVLRICYQELEDWFENYLYYMPNPWRDYLNWLTDLDLDKE